MWICLMECETGARHMCGQKYIHMYVRRRSTADRIMVADSLSAGAAISVLLTVYFLQTDTKLLMSLRLWLCCFHRKAVRVYNSEMLENGR